MSDFIFNCHKDFASFQLNADFVIGNELVVLFGPSGSGKSLTLRLISGLLAPSSGVIKMGEHTWYDSNSKIFIPPEKRQIGMVFQNLSLFPHMTIRENIAYPLSHLSISKEIKKQKVEEIILKFSLAEVAHKHVFHASGGQQQRAAIARAIIASPKLLLLDEPFSALDDSLRLQMHQIIRDIRKEQSIPVVLVTHNRKEADELSDRIIYFDRGHARQ